MLGPQAVSFQDWLRIDAAERAAGQPQGRPRIKMTDAAAMQQLLRSARAQAA